MIRLNLLVVEAKVIVIPDGIIDGCFDGRRFILEKPYLFHGLTLRSSQTIINDIPPEHHKVWIELVDRVDSGIHGLGSNVLIVVVHICHEDKAELLLCNQGEDCKGENK